VTNKAQTNCRFVKAVNKIKVCMGGEVGRGFWFPIQGD
jgi:hypothetical protein